MELPTAFVDVGERRLAYQDSGRGRPVVVLDAGLGCASDTWAPIFSPLTQMTRVIAYDRASLGGSDPPAPQPRTSQDVVSDLHALLTTAAIPGPYILVGHSFGGFTMRLYAHEYPAEAAAVVFIDAPHPNLNDRCLAVLPSPTPDESPALTSLRHLLAEGIKDPASNPEFIDWPASEAQVRATGALGDLPLVVLTAGKATPPPSFPPQVAASIDQVRRELQQDLVRLSTDSTHVVAEESSHFIHHDQPDIVINAVRRVVEVVRRQ